MLQITDVNFQKEVLESTVPVLVDFWAPWCGPCQRMLPVIDALASEIDGTKAKVGKCNVDENPDVSQKYGILSIPTFLVFKKGKVVSELRGVQPKTMLKNALD